MPEPAELAAAADESPVRARLHPGSIAPPGSARKAPVRLPRREDTHAGGAGYAAPDRCAPAAPWPLLVSHGRADTVVLPAMAEHVLATCPVAEASWYEGVGHTPHLEQPDRFNRELAALTRRVS